MHAVGYLRVSSKAQTVDMQRAAIERAAAARGDVITAWYSEKASGKSTKRAELERLRADARTGLFHRLYVFKLDRLTRSGVADTYAVVDDLNKAGVELVAIADGLHIKAGERDVVTDTLLFALGLAAKLERQAINDRIAAARARVEEQGGHWGRMPRVVDLERAKELQAAGMSTRDIAATLKVPRTTLRRHLAA